MKINSYSSCSYCDSFLKNNLKIFCNLCSEMSNFSGTLAVKCCNTLLSSVFTMLKCVVKFTQGLVVVKCSWPTHMLNVVTLS